MQTYENYEETSNTADADCCNDDEHVLHLWQPFKFITPESYDYVRDRFDQRFGTFLLRTFAILVLEIYNRATFGYSIKGRENLKALQSGAVTICNHIHPMDCTMINMPLYEKRLYYLTLESNFRIPLVRHIIRAFDAVPCPSRAHCMNEMFCAMRKAVEEGSFVQIYPEGSLIPYCKKLRKFKNGAFRMAVEADAPILPMVITQTPPSGLYGLYKKKPCLTLNILPPVYPDVTIQSQTERIETLKRQCFDAMNMCLR